MRVAPKSAFNIEIVLDVLLQIVAVVEAFLGLIFGVSNITQL